MFNKILVAIDGSPASEKSLGRSSRSGSPLQGEPQHHFLPGRDAVLVAQLGDRDYFEEMTPQDGDLLLGAEVTTGVLGHGVFLRS